MRVPSNEFLPAQMGLTNDPMIHQNLIQASRDKHKKGSTLAVVGCLLALAVLVGFVIWGVTSAPGPTTHIEPGGQTLISQE